MEAAHSGVLGGGVEGMETVHRELEGSGEEPTLQNLVFPYADPAPPMDL